ncbi:mCG147885 [Mus musculus]|nr:mCG147885 [Mus musculus]
MGTHLYHLLEVSYLVVNQALYLVTQVSEDTDYINSSIDHSDTILPNLIMTYTLSTFS